MPSPAEIDMSPPAITRRLKESAELWKLCQVLGKAELEGPVDPGRRRRDRAVPAKVKSKSSSTAGLEPKRG